MRTAPTLVAILTVVGLTFTERGAVEAEALPVTASRDRSPMAPLAPLPPATDSGRLRCECAPLEAPRWHLTERRVLGLKLLGFAALSGGAGLVFAWEANRIFDARPSQAQIASQNDQIRDRQLVAGTLLGLAGLSALAGAALVLWPESHHVSVMVLPSSGAFISCGGAI